MTAVALRGQGLIVLDDVVSPSEFRALEHEVACGTYRWVHAERWDKAWKLWDGHPLRGRSVYYDPTNAFSFNGVKYPTSSCVDTLIDTIRSLAANCPDVAGVEGVDWTALYLAPWLYPVGSALSLHRDAESYAGSFAFFVHAHWGEDWGGELIVSSPPDGPGDAGIATCVTPRPNRLVLLGPNRPHRIGRVDQNAGTHVRTTIAGFFLRPR
jgi:Rps23 Pro-64 3,4-dihydroxylase Tpa1-like proline 4-hydroxylase